MANLGHQEYRTNEILSSGNEELLLRLYSAVIESVKRAIISIETSDTVGKAKSIGKAVRIVTELLNALDPSANPELTANLERLYLFINARLVAANTENDKRHLETALQVLNQLNDGWEVALQGLRKSPAKAQAEHAQREARERSAGVQQKPVRRSSLSIQTEIPADYAGNLSITA